MVRRSGRIEPWAWTLVVVALCTVVARLSLSLLETANLAMIYVLGVVVVATRFGRAASILATVLGVAAFDFFCVPPYFSLLINETKYAVVFAVMLIVGLVVGTLTDRLRIREQEAQVTRTTIEIERQRNALLSVVSHDLRTPLATITGAATAILDTEGIIDRVTHRELVTSIANEAMRLDRLVGNLLEMTRLESGAVKPDRQWQPIEEPIGAALSRIAGTPADRRVRTVIPSGLPIVEVDGVLLEQVVTNLVDNALKHAPDSDVEIRARVEGEMLVVDVADRGPGLPPGQEERVFDKFHRGGARSGWGAGLGLTICRGILEAHGGRIWASARPEGGAVFSFALPVQTAPTRTDESGPEALR